MVKTKSNFKLTDFRKNTMLILAKANLFTDSNLKVIANARKPPKY
ncbi:hypothetical protein FPC831_1070003 [Flavobacterium psychrophilum]|nr:hypothetical protein FPC831_1070003 [Flavobacterium psychrophilum]SNB12980.1 hypothetical protein IT2_430195 [Flavobacterium psychrophilum]